MQKRRWLQIDLQNDFPSNLSRKGWQPALAHYGTVDFEKKSIDEFRESPKSPSEINRTRQSQNRMRAVVLARFKARAHPTNASVLLLEPASEQPRPGCHRRNSLLCRSCDVATVTVMGCHTCDKLRQVRQDLRLRQPKDPNPTFSSARSWPQLRPAVCRLAAPWRAAR
jgi:hypothetical protein